jgi:acyl CoA:acetate/3-ketoacid CoA transferase alpha subunit
MPNNKVVGLQEAISHIKSGMTMAVGGFLIQGDPLTLIRGLKASRANDLTIVSPSYCGSAPATC